MSLSLQVPCFLPELLTAGRELGKSGMGVGKRKRQEGEEEGEGRKKDKGSD